MQGAHEISRLSNRLGTVGSMAQLVGADVMISKLQGRPELNGKRGFAVSWDAQRGRVAVRLPPELGGESVLLKPDNLQGLIMRDIVPEDGDDHASYLKITADRRPPLYPCGPRWLHDPALKQRLISRCGGQIPDMMLEGYMHQRSLDAAWRRFGAAVRAIDSDERRPATSWAKDLLTPSGWELPRNRLERIGSVTVKQFSKSVSECMQQGTLQLLPGSTVPAQAQGLCDVCGTLCTSECALCGECFCSRACLAEGWNSHREVCETVFEDAGCSLGVLLTHTEMIGPDRDGVDIGQVLGFEPWRGGRESTPAPSNGSSSGSSSSSSGDFVACASCKRTLEKAAFSKSQQAKGAARRCKECVAEPRSDEQQQMQAVLQGVLDNKKSSQVARDFAMMRLCEPTPMPDGPPGPKSRLSTVKESNTMAKGDQWHRRAAEQSEEAVGSARSAEVLQLWSQVPVLEMYHTGEELTPSLRAELGPSPTERNAVAAASRAYLLNETMCSPLMAPDPSQPGHYSAFKGMPALAAAARRIAGDSSEADTARADAHSVLSYLHTCCRPPDGNMALKELSRAIALRPNDGLQRCRRAALHASAGDFSKAVPDLKKARELFEGPHAELQRTEATGDLGKSLAQLGRGQQATVELRQYVEAASSGPLASMMTDRERGHTIVGEYMLVYLLGEHGKIDEAKRHFKAAEKRESALPRSVHERIDWSQKMHAQMWVASNSSATGAHRECRGCSKPTEQPKTCQRCQLAVYCSKECQVSHWPIHKKECNEHKHLSSRERQAVRDSGQA